MTREIFERENRVQVRCKTAAKVANSLRIIRYHPRFTRLPESRAAIGAALGIGYNSATTSTATCGDGVVVSRKKNVRIFTQLLFQ